MNETVGKLDEFIKGCVAANMLNGVILAAKNGHVIYKKTIGMAHTGWNVANTTDTKFHLYSLSKQFTALLVLELVEKGKIKLEDTLADYLPYYPKDIARKITIHHLLTHTHGLIDSLPTSNFPITFTGTSREFVTRYLNQGLEAQPGSRYKYSMTVGYGLLAAVITELAGKSFKTVLKETIFEPLGLTQTGYIESHRVLEKQAVPYGTTLAEINTDFPDYPCNGSSGLYSTVEDLYLWDRALYSEKITAAQFRDLLFKPYVPTLTAHYGYGWFLRSLSLEDRKIDFVSHSGGGCNIICRVPRDGHLVVFLNNLRCPLIIQIGFELLKILYDQPHEIPRESFTAAFYSLITARGLDEAVAKYKDLKKDFPRAKDYSETQLRQLGQFLLRAQSTINSHYT